MNLLELLPRTAGLAIADRRQQLSFAELERATAAVAAQLRADGLRPGDHVLLLHPVTIELYVALLGVLRLGAVAMFLEPSAGTDHVARCCALQPPRALLGSRKALLWRWLVPALRRVPLCRRIVMPATGSGTVDKPEPVAADAPALLTFTSGSTGQPKAALRSHGFLQAQHQALAATLGLCPGEPDLATLPIFVLANLASAVPSILADADWRRPGQIDPGPVLAQIDRWQVRSVAASPAFLARIVEGHAPSWPRANPSLGSLRKIFTGGAPVFPGLLDRLQSVAPQAEVVAVYGSTEAEPMAHLSRAEISADDRHRMEQGGGLLAGRPIPGLDLRVVADQWGQPRTEAVSLPVNEPGEIVVAGAHVLPGYLHGAGDHETKFDAEGRRWHRTGDAGYLDAQGRLWLLGRCAAKVSDAHGTLYPLAVETAAQPWRTAFVSVAGRRVLVVEPDAPADLAQRLAWAQLAEIRVLRQIPLDKRHNAKIDYPALRRQLGS